MSHQFTHSTKALKDEPAYIVFDRVYKECKKWTWRKVFAKQETETTMKRKAKHHDILCGVNAVGEPILDYYIEL